MKIGIKDKIRQTDFFNTNQPFLERIASLYFQGQSADEAIVQDDLRALLEKPGNNDPQEIILHLHAAVMLAQNNVFDGITYLFQLLIKTNDTEIFNMTHTALRNCSQFPLAVLLAQTVDLKKINLDQPEFQELFQLSDDDIFHHAQQSNKVDFLNELNVKINNILNTSKLKDRAFAIGTIISRPVRKDFGYRYTGFIGIDRNNRLPLIVPYDMGDILNRNDQHANIDLNQLLKGPGCQALVVYDINPPYEAQQVFILPFQPLSKPEIDEYVKKLYSGAEGLDFGIVVELKADQYGNYRVITTGGQTKIIHYQKEIKKIGDCVFLHRSNSQTLNTYFHFSSDIVSQVAKQFKCQSELEKAVYIKSFVNKHTNKKIHTIATNNGQTLNFANSIAENQALFVEQVTISEKCHYFPFKLDNIVWSEMERVAILNDFFSKKPDAFGVVLKTNYIENKYEDSTSDSYEALVIHKQSGKLFYPIVDRKYSGGILVFIDNGKDGRYYSNIMPNYQMTGGCSICYGTSYTLCRDCQGNGAVICSVCNGSQRITCPECNGTGKSTCGHCDGEGERDCWKCQGSGQFRLGECNRCDGSGIYGSSICDKCDGSGDFKKPCKKCSGTGKLPCNTCGETGLWNCATCRKTGEIRCNCDHGYVQCPACQGKGLTHCLCNAREKSMITTVDAKG